jgi:hypothetical protein
MRMRDIAIAFVVVWAFVMTTQVYSADKLIPAPGAPIITFQVKERKNATSEAKPIRGSLHADFFDDRARRNEEFSQEYKFSKALDVPLEIVTSSSGETASLSTVHIMGGKNKDSEYLNANQIGLYGMFLAIKGLARGTITLLVTRDRGAAPELILDPAPTLP